jgi:hypothetical protein
MRGQASGCNKLLSRHGGINLQQEVAPQQTARSPRDSSNRRIPTTACRGKLNIQADGGLFIGFPRYHAQQAAAAELCVRHYERGYGPPRVEKDVNMARGRMVATNVGTILHCLSSAAGVDIVPNQPLQLTAALYSPSTVISLGRRN